MERSIFVKYRLKRDVSETSFRSHVKWPVLVPKNGPYLELVVPLTWFLTPMVLSVLFKTRFLGSAHKFMTQPARKKNDCLKRLKNRQKAEENTTHRPQNRP